MFSNKLSSSLALAAAMIAIAAAFAYARHYGLVGNEPARGAMLIVGVLLAGYANYIPKTPSKTSARRRAVQRLAGWAFFVAGIVYAAVWALAPFAIAADLSMLVCGIAVVGVFSYCVWLRTTPPVEG
jgi:hypothetical protein